MQAMSRMPNVRRSSCETTGAAPGSAVDQRAPSRATLAKAGRVKGPRTKKTTIRDLISYRLARASSLMSRGAALRYRREFGVSRGEWRALALLAAGAPQSMMELTRAAGLDKAQMSRVVTSLIARGLVVRESFPETSRGGVLSLTSDGHDVYAGLIAAASERDRAFRCALAPEELAVLETALDKLAKEALRFIKVEAAKTKA